MKIVQSEDTIFIDVDCTLVMPATYTKGKIIRILDPVTQQHVIQRIHAPMVRLLKEADRRGSYVVVWSRGGWEWARNVVIALNLEKYVDQVMTKPLVYFDDKPVEDWLSYQVYIDPKEDYKSVIK